MPTATLTRLNTLHTKLELFRKSDNNPLLPNKFLDSHLSELAAVIIEFQRLERIQELLNDLGGAMTLLLELLQSADQKLHGCLLYCLLKPLKEKIDQVMDEMERMV